MVIFQWQTGRAFLAQLTHGAPYKIRSARGRQDATAHIENMQMDLAGGRDVDLAVAQSRLLAILFIMARDWVDRVSPACAKGGKNSARLHRRVLIQRARIYMHTHYQDNNISVERIARALGLSASRLSHVFSAESDFTVLGYLTRVRMEKARALLNEGKLNIAEVARAIGYKDSQYFTNVFHKHYGYPPNRMRV